MKIRKSAIPAALAIGLLLGVAPAMSQVTVGFGIRFGPPHPRHEVVVAAPFEDAVWISGHWAWDEYAGRYVWIGGSWVPARPYQMWVNGSWHHGPRGWAWREGYWGHRDRGREDRHERHGDGDGRHGRYR